MPPTMKPANGLADHSSSTPNTSAGETTGRVSGIPLGWTVVAEDASGPEPAGSLGDLHAEVCEYDPSGRAGAPRLLEERLLASLDPALQTQLRALVDAGQLARASLLWHRHTGQDLPTARLAVERLRGRWR